MAAALGPGVRLRSGQELPVAPAAPDAVPQRVYIERDDLGKHGYTEGCEDCDAARLKLRARAHTEACRARIETSTKGDAEAERGLARAEIHRALYEAVHGGQAAGAAAAVPAADKGRGPMVVEAPEAGAAAVGPPAAAQANPPAAAGPPPPPAAAPAAPCPRRRLARGGT